MNDNSGYKQDLSYYRKFWPARIEANMRLGEFSPQYLYDEQAPIRIHELFPNVKMLVILRNPLERTISHFMFDKYFKQVLPADISFTEAMENYDYLLELGKYHNQLERYYQLFDKEQIKVFIMEDLDGNLDKVIKEVYKFIEVDPEFFPNNINALNQSREVKYRWMSQIFKIPAKIKDSKLGRLSLMEKAFRRIRKSSMYIQYTNLRDGIIDKNFKSMELPEIDEGTRNKINSYFKEDVQKMEALLGRDLKVWLN